MWYGIGNTGVKNPSTARVEMDPEGNITLFTGCAELGQGSTTVLTQIACEIIGIQPQNLNVVVGDTHLTTNAGATSASRLDLYLRKCGQIGCRTAGRGVKSRSRKPASYAEIGTGTGIRVCSKNERTGSKSDLW